MVDKKAPELRFKGFTDDWEQRKLGDISDVTKLAGFEFTKHVKYSDEGEIIALRGLNVKNGDLVLDDVKYIDESDFSKLNRSKLIKDDILFTYVGTVGQLALVPENDKFYLAPNVARVRVNNGINSMFLGQQMSSSVFYSKVVFPLIATSSQPALSMENIRKFQVFISAKDEQDKVASFFKQLDEVITLHQRKLDQLKDLKQAYLQQLFPSDGNYTPKVRFANFKINWEQCKLNKIAELNPKSVIPEVFEYVDLESVVGIELIGHRTENKYFAPSRAQRLAQNNDIFFQTVRPYQKNNYLFELPYNNYVFSTGYTQIRPRNNGYFLLNLVQEKSFVNKVLERCTGTSYPAINSNDLAEIPIRVPIDTNEEIQIGSFFKQLDKNITLHKQKLSKLERLKSAYLQKMFI